MTPQPRLPARRGVRAMKRLAVCPKCGIRMRLTPSGLLHAHTVWRIVGGHWEPQRCSGSITRVEQVSRAEG